MIWSRNGVCTPRGTAWLVAVATMVFIVAPPGVNAYLLRGAPQDARVVPEVASVTLVTGDRVELRTRPGGGSTAIVVAAAGREGIGFVTLSSPGEVGGEEITVIPADAAPLLAAGLLDPELFNVTGLVRQGLTGGDGSGPPLILTFAARARAAAVSLADAGIDQGRLLPSINAVAGAPSRAAPGTFWRWFSGGGGPERTAAVAAGRATSLALAAGVTKVWLDGRAQPLLNESGPQIGLPRARQMGLTGNGVTIAILDSGIKTDHPDLTGRVTESRDFTDLVPDASDDVGHGTHVASIAAGTGAASDGRYQGVAPQATLINGKVCVIFGCPFSAVIAGMEWAAPKARIVNMSLGGNPSDGTDPMSMALDALAAQHGTLFVVAAGNFGRTQSIASPASAQEALAVGNATKQDAISSTSSRGPRLRDFAIKPDIVAPGTSIVAARAAGTLVGDDDPVDAQYARVSGTSMAAPHVTGVAALLLEAHPDWSAAQIRAAVTSSATPLAGGTVYDQGAGRLDVGRAVSQPVLATGNLSFDLIRWPHDQPPSTRTVTYTNDGDTPVTIQLALDVTDAQGAPAPAGLFTVDADRLTVPARGAADVQVTFDPLEQTPSEFGGRLIAIGESAAVVTPVGAFQEVESYDLTIRAVGRAPSFSMIGWAANVDTGDPPERVSLDSTNDTVTLRLRKGHYQVDGLISSNGLPTDPEQFTSVLASEPDILLDADTTVVLDATRARRLSTHVEHVSTVPVVDSLVLTSQIGPADQHINIGTTHSDSVASYAVPTRPVTGRTYVFTYEPVVGVRAGTDPAANEFSSLYNLGIFISGRIPERLTFRTRARDLALRQTAYHAQGMPDRAFRHDVAFPTDLDLAISRDASSFAVPTRRAEYFTAHPDIGWRHHLSIGTGTSIDFEDSALLTYRAGSVQSVGWNRAPLGPAFAQLTGFGSGRREDAIAIRVALFSGNQEGHAGDSSFLPPGVTGATTLSRNGTPVGSTDLPCAGTFPVPEGPVDSARYTLTCSGTRDLTSSNLGTHADATFTFIDPGPTAGAQALPLLAVRATGSVSALNSAPAGSLFPLSLRVERPANAARAPITAVRLDVSYDDGATWVRADVASVPGSDRAVALLHHPRAPGFVSLRAHAADARGNTVTQTMIRAYSLVIMP